MACFADDRTSGTLISGSRLQAMGKLEADSQVEGNPTNNDNEGVIQLTRPPFTFRGTTRAHMLHADGSFSSS